MTSVGYTKCKTKMQKYVSPSMAATLNAETDGLWDKVSGEVDEGRPALEQELGVRASRFLVASLHYRFTQSILMHGLTPSSFSEVTFYYSMIQPIIHPSGLPSSTSPDALSHRPSVSALSVATIEGLTYFCNITPR